MGQRAQCVAFLRSPDLVATGYRRDVPMGGDLRNSPDSGSRQLPSSASGFGRSRRTNM